MLIIKRKLGKTEKKKHAVLKGRVILVQRTGMAGMRTWLSSAKYLVYFFPLSEKIQSLNFKMGF